MFDLATFDTTSYTEILSTMKHQLETSAGVTLYDSDMETVLLELWALMLDMQNYTMDVTTTQMEQAMTNFLCGDAPTMTSAEGYLFAQPKDNHWIFQHTLFDYLANLPFECCTSTYLQNNDILCVMHEQLPFLFPLKENLSLELSSKLTLTLVKPMAIDYPFSIYFEINNARTHANHKYAQGKLSIAYETKHGWHDIDYEDNTIAFLQSGTLTLYPKKEHAMNRDRCGYRVCIQLDAKDYDELPIIKNIYLNPILVKQQRTDAFNYTFPIQNTYVLQDELAINGNISMLKLHKGVYQPIKFQKRITPDSAILSTEETIVGEEVLVIVHRAGLLHDGIIASTTGISMQTVNVPYTGIYSMEAMLKQADYYHKFEIARFGEQRQENGFGAWYDKEEGILRFGDGSDFLIPQQGVNNVILSKLMTTFGAQGNIKSHSLDHDIFIQWYPFIHGKDEDSYATKLQHAWDFRMQYTSAFFKEEIVKAVFCFPGNALRKVACLSAKKYFADDQKKGYVIIVSADQTISDIYIKNLKRWLEDKIPFGIFYEIRSGRPYPINVQVQVSKTSQLIEERSIKQAIEQWIDKLSFGVNIKSKDLMQIVKEIVPTTKGCQLQATSHWANEIQLQDEQYAIIANITYIYAD